MPGNFCWYVRGLDLGVTFASAVQTSATVADQEEVLAGAALAPAVGGTRLAAEASGGETMPARCSSRKKHANV